MTGPPFPYPNAGTARSYRAAIPGTATNIPAGGKYDSMAGRCPGMTGGGC